MAPHGAVPSPCSGASVACSEGTMSVSTALLVAAENHFLKLPAGDGRGKTIPKRGKIDKVPASPRIASVGT